MTIIPGTGCLNIFSARPGPAIQTEKLALSLMKETGNGTANITKLLGFKTTSNKIKVINNNFFNNIIPNIKARVKFKSKVAAYWVQTKEFFKEISNLFIKN